MTVAIGVFDLKATHVIAGNQLQGLQVVSRHSRAVLEFCSEVVEKVCIHTHAGGDSKVTRGGLAFEILILDSSERDASNRAFDRQLRGDARSKRNLQVVGESVRRSKRKNGERHWRPN